MTERAQGGGMPELGDLEFVMLSTHPAVRGRRWPT